MFHKIMTNRKIADIFEEIALFLHAQDIPFKPQAYEAAAQSLRALSEELAEMYRRCGNSCLRDITGIGKHMAEKIREAILKGKIREYETLKKQFPFDMLGLTRVQEIGPKTALMLYRKLKIKNVKDLERAAKTGKIAHLPRMGYKTERNILRALEFLKKNSGRQIIHLVLPFARQIIEKLKVVPGVTHMEIAGSLRRRSETIGDIDLLSTTSKPRELIEAFKRLTVVSEILEEGLKKVAVRYTNNMNGDLRILKPDEFGTGIVYFTGSKEHNILLRERAIKKKMKLSEYGLFRKTQKQKNIKTEKHVYAALGLQYIPPEIRVGADEIERAAKKKIPTLIAYGTIEGDCQVQTNWSDGSASIEEMALAAKSYGLSYLAITDHTQSLAIANGLNEKRLREQGKEIDRLNKKLNGIHILKSTECDVKSDGTLDLKDDALKTLDFVCVSIHLNRGLSKQKMTERIIRALKHPLVHVLFHPTGRIVNARESYEVEMDQVIKAAKFYKVALEVNGSERMDMAEKWIRQAVQNKVKLLINSDAHTPEQFSNLDIGIGQARRGWTKKSDVLNTKTFKEFLKALKK